MNRLIQTSYPDGTTTGVTYNWRGQTLTSTDQEGRVTTYGYDLAGQLLTVTAADNSTTQTAYDAAGRRISSTDQLGHVTTYAYDNAGRLVKDHQRAEPEHSVHPRRRRAADRGH